jgi:hypothetical protein
MKVTTPYDPYRNGPRFRWIDFLMGVRLKVRFWMPWF